jgi:hypothetical protein
MSVINWKPEGLFNLFGVDWESSQLKAIADSISLKNLNNSYIAGGAVVRSLMGTDPFKGDIDIFCSTAHALETCIDKYSANKDWSRTEHAYNTTFTLGMKKTKLQIITRDKPNFIQETIHRFDFEHCKFALFEGPKGYSIVSTMASPVCLANRELRLGLVRDPNYSLGRAIKYKRMGFNADKAIETLAAMSIKGMKDVQLCNDPKRGGLPFSFDDVETVVASCSS